MQRLYQVLYQDLSDALMGVFFSSARREYDIMLIILIIPIRYTFPSRRLLLWDHYYPKTPYAETDADVEDRMIS